MAVDLSHLPDIELDTRSVQLMKAYLTTWQRVGHRPDAMIEFLAHLHVRTVLGLDAPLDRRAMALLSLTILEYIRDRTRHYPETQRLGDIVGRRELLAIAQGNAVTIGLDDHGAAGSLVIERGHLRVDLSRPIELGRATWKIQVGPWGRAVSPSKTYSEVGAVSAVRIVDAHHQILGGHISWREFAAEWLVVWQRQMARILLEPRVPASLRQLTASAAMISLGLLKQIGTEHDDHTADDVLPSAQCQAIWNRALDHIADGGLVLAELASEQPIVFRHFETCKAFGGDDTPAVSVHPDLVATFSRVSEATLVSGEALASRRSGAERRDVVEKEGPQPAQRAKIGRNEPCPCGSGRKYKKCCYENYPHQ